MNDDQVEKLIWNEINKRKIVFQDMIGLPGHGVDPNPEDKTLPGNKRARANRFKSFMGSSRMAELLCVGEYNAYGPIPPLKISLHDLFRFWWNRCVEKHLVVEDILDDIFDYYTEQMRPHQKTEPEMNLDINFDQLTLFNEDMDEAA